MPQKSDPKSTGDGVVYIPFLGSLEEYSAILLPGTEAVPAEQSCFPRLREAVLLLNLRKAQNWDEQTSY